MDENKKSSSPIRSYDDINLSNPSIRISTDDTDLDSGQPHESMNDTDFDSGPLRRYDDTDLYHPIRTYEKAMDKYAHLYNLIKFDRVEDIRLIVSGHDIHDVRSPCGGTPLNVATMFHNVNIVELLKQYGCSVGTPRHAIGAYVKSTDKYAHLYNLIRYNRVEDIKQIVGRHDVSRVRSPSGWTPLNVAAMFNNIEIYELLVRHGCCIDIKSRAVRGFNKSKQKYVHLYDLIRFNRFEELKMIMNCHDLSAIRSPSGATPLHVAAMFNKVKIFELFIQHGCDMEATNDLNETILHWAKGYNSNDMVNLIMEMCPHLDEAVDTTGNTPNMFPRKFLKHI